MGVEIYPILGTGPSPFRGNLNPYRVTDVLNEYKGVYTFTIQSSFKYDHAPEIVINAIHQIKNSRLNSPDEIDEKRVLEIIDKYSKEYQRQITELAPVINIISKYVPKRRKRKLHIGLFGYSRENFGVKLPRAIPFVCSMYSLGFPPELLGINSLNRDDFNILKIYYKNFKIDLEDSLRYINFDSPFIPNEIKNKLYELDINFYPNQNHKEIVDSTIDSINNNKYDSMTDLMLKSSLIRKFLG